VRFKIGALLPNKVLERDGIQCAGSRLRTSFLRLTWRVAKCGGACRAGRQAWVVTEASFIMLWWDARVGTAFSVSWVVRNVLRDRWTSYKQRFVTAGAVKYHSDGASDLAQRAQRRSRAPSSCIWLVSCVKLNI
jgi:hypothetical protein